MSTKLSTDLNITRPSTRVHVPPGGRTTIQFGTNDTSVPAARAVPADPNAEEKAAHALQLQIANVKIEEKKIKLSVVVAGRSEATEAIVAAVSKSLQELNVTGATIVHAPDFYSLPYVAQSLVKTQEALIVAAFLPAEFANANVYASSISASLYNLGVASNTPIIPAVIAISHLLEAKATLPDLSMSWVQSVLDFVDYKVEKSPVAPVEIKPKVVIVPGASTDDLIENLRDSIKAHGATGITGLGRKFRIMDDDKSGQIDLSEFTKVIKEHGLLWSPSQIKSVFDFFDNDKSGNISYEEFLQGVRGELNPRRLQLVLQAFEILDSEKLGYVGVEHIASKYNASKHPDVISGKRTQSEILMEFLEVFEVGGEKDGKLTFDEFKKYYGNISASIDLDDYFELVIRNAWHISGGEGWCANTSNRRVLVVHRDGRQTVEEIKNDLGIGADDKEAMLANLKAQGIKDAVSIDTKGSTSEATPEPAPAAPPAPVKDAAPRPGSAATGTNPRRAVGGKSTITFG